MNSVRKYWLDWINNKNKDNCDLGKDVQKGLYSDRIKIQDVAVIVDILNESHKKVKEQESKNKLPYIPECKYGYEDCISDPAYQRHYYSSDNCGTCDGCVDGCWYDDEDK